MRIDRTHKSTIGHSEHGRKNFFSDSFQMRPQMMSKGLLRSKGCGVVCDDTRFSRNSVNSINCSTVLIESNMCPTYVL
jgi:hypothetical protein